MGLSERTDPIFKWNMEYTGTASRTQKEKSPSCLLKHINWWRKAHTFKIWMCP